MRTKVYLAALCLPLAFAACTNEDFIEQGVDLSSRGEIDVTISAVKGVEGQADTRLDIVGSNFMWEAGEDVIGAAMIDGGATVNGNVLVNYPFTADQSGATSTFSGKSSVTRGKYFFYYGYEDNLNRGLLNLNVPAQVYKVGDAKSAKSQAVSYMKGVSPIVDLAKGITYTGAQQAALDLRFVPLYTLIRVDINSANIPSGVTPTVTKVSLNTGGGFVSKAAANLLSIQNTAGVVPLKNDGSIDAAKRDAAVAKLATMVAKAAGLGGIYSGTYNNGKVSGGVAGVETAENGAATVKVEGDLILEAGKVTSVYLLAPKGTYANLVLTVQTSEGEYTRTIGKQVTLANAEQPINAELDFDRASGNVSAVTEFTIANVNDWNEAVTFIDEHPTSYVGRGITFKLIDNIEVASLPNYNLDIEGYDAALKTPTDRTITLTGNYTINAANKSLYKTTNIKWVVDESAVMNINAEAAVTSFASITNKGTLNVNDNVNAEVTNYGTINVRSDAHVKGAMTNGRPYVNDNNLQIEGTINVAEGIMLYIDADLTNNCGEIVVEKDAAVALKTVTLANGGNRGATITMKGSLTKQSGEAPTVTNNGGTIDLFGKLDVELTNNGGTLIVEDGAISNGVDEVAKGKVIVKNVTTFADTQANTNRKFIFATSPGAPVVTTTVSNGSEFSTANTVRMNYINDITLNGGEWTLDTSNGTTEKKISGIVANVTSITLDGASLTLNAAFNKKLNVSGTCKLKGSGVTEATIDELRVSTNGELSVEGLAVNTQVGNTAKAYIDGTLNVEAGAAMYYSNATVGQYGVLKVKGNSSSSDSPAIFGSVQSQFLNSGLVESLASSKSSGTKVAGRVTQPTNQGGATFKGNADREVNCDITVLSTTIDKDLFYVNTSATVNTWTANNSELVGSGTVTIKVNNTTAGTNKVLVKSSSIKIVLGTATSGEFFDAGLTDGSDDTIIEAFSDNIDAVDNVEVTVHCATSSASTTDLNKTYKMLSGNWVVVP